MDVRMVWTATLRGNRNAISCYCKEGMKMCNPPEDIREHPFWKKKNLHDYVFFCRRNHENG